MLIRTTVFVDPYEEADKKVRSILSCGQNTNFIY